MDKEKELKTVIGAVIVIALLWVWQNYKVINKLEKDITYAESQTEECEYELRDYQDALEEANNSIEEANSQIEDAQYTAWSSYDDMGEFLENLYTVETVNEP